MCLWITSCVRFSAEAGVASRLHNGRQLTRSECTEHSVISWHSRTQSAVLQFWVMTSYPRAHKLARRLTHNPVPIQHTLVQHRNKGSVEALQIPTSGRLLRMRTTKLYTAVQMECPATILTLTIGTTRTAELLALRAGRIYHPMVVTSVGG